SPIQVRIPLAPAKSQQRTLFGPASSTSSAGKPDDACRCAEGRAVTLNFGVFLNAVIQFLIVSFAVFWLIKVLTRMHIRQEPAAAEPPPPPRSELAASSSSRPRLISASVAVNG